MRIYRLVTLLVIYAVILGCASVPSENNQAPLVANTEPALPEEAPKSGLSQVLSKYQRDRDEQLLQISLIALAQQYQEDFDCHSASLVIKHTLPLLTDERIRAKANIIRSECAIVQVASEQAHLAINDDTALLSTQDNQVMVRLLSNWLNEIDSSRLDNLWQARKSFLDAYLMANKGEYERALLNSLAYDSSISVIASVLPQLQFAWLSQLTPSEKQQLTITQPRMTDYQRMLSIIENERLSDRQRQQALLEQVKLTNNAIEPPPIPSQVTQFLSLEANAQQNIAVLLPLSGRLTGQGDAIKQGMLASYYEQLRSALEGVDTLAPSLQLTFLDTGSQPDLLETINKESMQNYSLIIGPLLKSHVEQVQDLLPVNALRIHLNQTNFDSLGSTVTEASSAKLVNFFALAPEQEAEELAQRMLAANIRHPVLIFDDSALTQRMADAFLDAWNKSLTDSMNIAPSQVKFSDNKSMRVGITSALDVLQSQQRINQLSNLVEENVFSVTRNRRDVDAFVVFARPNEIELINPIIESSMSLFTGEQIPVYASSLSYNHKQNKNTIRDLRNLVFLDMPFLLPEGRQSDLAIEVDKLFRQPSSTYLRLFAFGYDALTLSQQIVRLRTFNNSKISGLSGDLSLNENGLIQRKLDTLAINTGK